MTETEQLEENRDPLDVVVIGVGGIGTALVPLLLRFLHFHNPGSSVTLVDGDEFEDDNEDRQDFLHPGNKAKSVQQQFEDRFSQIMLQSIPKFIAPPDSKEEDNLIPVQEVVKEGDVVFCCVDNHKTRKLLSDHCLHLKNITLFSGGNEYYTGDVQIMARKKEDVVYSSYYTLSKIKVNDKIYTIHPEIEEPEDKHPTELGCQDLIAKHPQLLFVNAGVAVEMVKVFFTTCILGRPPVGVVNFDMLTHTTQAITRSKKES